MSIKARLNPVSILGIVAMLVALGGLLPVAAMNPDIWWTPVQMALPYPAATDRVHILLEGRPLEKRLEGGALLLRYSDGSVRPLTSADFALRLNNWDRVRAWAYLKAIVYTVLGTLGLCMFLFGWLAVPRLRAAPSGSLPPAKDQ